MKRIFALLVLAVFVFAACGTSGGGSIVSSKLNVKIPELFSPDPDIENDTMTVSIEAAGFLSTVKDWAIQIDPIRAQTEGQSAPIQNPPAAAGADGQATQRQSRGPFYEEKGEGLPPREWKWDGRSSREPRAGREREMVQSATDYQFTLTVNDYDGVPTVYEGVIAVDVLVRRDANGDLRMIVPSIMFPPSSADFARLSQQETRSNERVLRLVGRALSKYADYKVTIEGHANPTTPPGTPARTTEQAGDLVLSQQRAQAVVDYLAANQNIDKTRFTVVGIGNSRTVADYDDPDENWKNRRVEFILKK